jgi:hypothetical protein
MSRMCNIQYLRCSGFAVCWLVGWLGLVTSSSGCRPAAKPPVESGPALPLSRIGIVGASVSAGLGGTPFGDAFRQAAKGASVESWANVMLFRDPVGETRQQLGKALAFHATTVVGVDLLFWHVYNVGSIDAGLAEVDKLYASGAWIVIGDVPLITTASELLLPKDAIPSQATLDAANAKITAWAARDRVLLVPLAEWTEPLRAEADVEISPGEKVPAASLMAIDGLHANPLGTWYLLNRLDHWIEDKLPGTPKDALVFARPKPE